MGREEIILRLEKEPPKNSIELIRFYINDKEELISEKRIKEISNKEIAAVLKQWIENVDK